MSTRSYSPTTFDNGFTHLLGGLVVASLVGVVGAVLGTGLT